MTKKHFFFICLFLLFGRVFSQNDARIPIAMNDLKGSGIDQPTAGLISDRLRSELVNTGMFRVMERSEMESILKEQGFQQSGVCDEASCLVQVGQVLGVQRMVAGSIGKVNDFWTMSLRMLNVSTGEILFTISEDYKGDVEGMISHILSRAAFDLASKGSPFGAIKVTSEPAGANVFLNDKSVGATPYENAKLMPDKYMLSLRLVGYETVKDSLLILRQQTCEKHYDLIHTKAFADSINACKQSTHRKFQWIRRLSFGMLAIGSGITGVVFNNNSNTLYNDYLADKSYDAGKHDSEWQSVKNAETMRNVCYVIASVCVAALAVSIPF